MQLDDETKEDLHDAFIELYGEVEQCVFDLLQGSEKASIHRLFRAIHNVKGNAGILQLSSIVEFSHEVEEVAGALRKERIPLTEAVGEVLLIAMDRLSDLHQKELFDAQFDYLCIDELKLLYHSLSIAEADEADGIANQILQFLGVGPVGNNIDIFASSDATAPANIQSLNLESSEDKISSDLAYFQKLALLVDGQFDGGNGRTRQLYDWAMKMNKLAGLIINKDQLAMAIYAHDIGMSFLPKGLWANKTSLYTQSDSGLIQHPYLGYNYLVRIPGWEEAATIVLQHHEHVNGSGYPSGLKGDEIHPGAKILAILDAFFFLAKGRVDPSARRSTVRAVSAVNARVDSEFEGMWVQCFNHIIRGELKAGKL